MAHPHPPDSGTASLVESYPQSPATTTLDAIADIPEEHIWLASRKSPRTRRAYRRDVEHFMRTLNIRAADELHRVDHKAVLAWEAYMREVEQAEASTIRRRLAALSSLFKHLVKHGVADRNPVRDVERPPVNRREGFTPAFSKSQARRLLDLPPDGTVAGFRDRAILSVGLQVGLRRAEIAVLRVGDLHVNRGFDSLRVTRKRAKKDALAINPQAAQRIRAYLAVAGHADDFDGPLFRPLRHNGRQRSPRRHMNPDAIDRIVKRYAHRIGLTRGYSAHSMRATFITTALDNGCSLEDVQRAAEPSQPAAGARQIASHPPGCARVSRGGRRSRNHLGVCGLDVIFPGEEHWRLCQLWLCEVIGSASVVGLQDRRGQASSPFGARSAPSRRKSRPCGETTPPGL